MLSAKGNEQKETKLAVNRNQNHPNSLYKRTANAPPLRVCVRVRVCVCVCLFLCMWVLADVMSVGVHALVLVCMCVPGVHARCLLQLLSTSLLGLLLKCRVYQ